ncbi:hypothetical protein [uncultured Croceitalea sp.]|uniref:hypothetical protein n=1 Tax=uncultured Croceitalea sp. TaxID=1798908 RepID=UPI003305E2DF
MWRKQFVLIFLVLGSMHAHSQVKNIMTVRVEPGALLWTDSDNLGLLLNVEPNINILEKFVIGLRFGIAVNSQKFEGDQSTQFTIDGQNDNAILSFIPTFDYYLNFNYTRPYLGLGLGYYVLSTIDVSQPGPSILDGSINNQIGVLLRGGLEHGKIRFGFEYNYVPKADIIIPDGQIVGAVENAYYGVSVGFRIGGGKL